jgi:hypothetical protein
MDSGFMVLFSAVLKRSVNNEMLTLCYVFCMLLKCHIISQCLIVLTCNIFVLNFLGVPCNFFII